MNTKPELVAPAGTPEKLKTAFLYGADAVYCAGKEFGLRAQAGNFTDEELKEGAEYAHSLGKKLFVAVNVFARNNDFDTLPDYLALLHEIGIDRIMVSDPGVIHTAKKVAPDLPLALSTQANCTNTESALFWKELGISRVVLARELSISEITEIRKTAGVEIEVFTHGAVCISYSGRCFISRYLTGKDANRGDCTHSCRWKYALTEEKRPGEYFPVEEDERGTYFFNARDICLLSYVPQLMEAGVDAFKIEGRMKSVSYIASTVAVYRDAIETFAENPEAEIKDEWIAELMGVSTRNLTEGMIRGTDLPEDYSPESKINTERKQFVGVAAKVSGGILTVDVRNQFKTGDTLEFLLPGFEFKECTVASLIATNRSEAETDTVHPNDTAEIPIVFDVPAGTIIRKQ